MTCSICKTSAAQHELRGGMCHQCTYIKLLRRTDDLNKLLQYIGIYCPTVYSDIVKNLTFGSAGGEQVAATVPTAENKQQENK